MHGNSIDKVIGNISLINSQSLINFKGAGGKLQCQLLDPIGSVFDPLAIAAHDKQV